MKFDLGCCTTYFFFTIARASVSCRQPTHPSARYRSALAGILPLIIFFDWPFTFLRLVQHLEMSLQPLAKILVEALIALQLGFGDYFFICYSVIIHHKNNRSADDCQQNAWRSQGSTLSFLAGCPKSHFLGWYRNFLVYWYLKLDNQVVNSTCPKDKLGWIWRADDP